MLRFRPKTYKDSGEKYLQDENALGYIAYDDNENECGFIVFYLNGYSMEITEAEVFDGDAKTYEGLIRSALNYGANRNAYIAFYSARKASDVAKMLGFESQGDKLYGEIPFLLQGRCCKEND
ncbi:MAG: hypothetical protein IJU45_06405 [Clostridia bacterium]|nr:hypothetical protein [Clostridia bacterium]